MDLNPTEKSKSVFNATGIIENGLLELRLYNSLNNKLVIIEHPHMLETAIAIAQKWKHRFA